jgi:cytochrome c biogenesis protein CcmG/thiol:disulfide interchange protein DsbE
MSNRPNQRPSSSARIRQAQADSRATGGTSRIYWIAGIAVFLVLAALVAAIAISRSSDSTATGGSGGAAGTVPNGGTVVPAGNVVYGTVQISGTPLPEPPKESGTADPAVGMQAPVVTGQTFAGTPLTLPAPGKPAVIMFVAHWCPHCRAEVPLITEDLASKGLPQGVDLYAVSTSASEEQTNFPPAAWLRTEGWPVPTVADDQNKQIADAYGVSGFPFFVVVDAQGRVVARTSGELPIEQFNQLIDSARAGRSVA